MSKLKTEELRTIAAQVGDVGGWRVAGLKIIWAADEIERLTRERDEWKEWHANMQALRDKHSASVDRLTAEIERLTRELEEERELHLTARGQSDAYEMGMESWKDGYERLMRELEAMEDARDIAQAEGALMEMERDRLRAALERVARWNEHFEYAFSQDIMEFAREALQEPK